ncbi:sulfurtransferase [Ectobacillus polymachus]|uniref:sulfurtransferase n=1 Tax=Ectobacillus polymachus TaxID=1508806 RepID=UPI003A8BA4CF
MNHIVEADWLDKHLHDEGIRIIDCRFHLGDPQWGRAEYEKGHIENALYFDLNKDLSSPVQAHGGRHPLPDTERFVQILSEAGIDEYTTVVAYDSEEGAMASRLWWLLTFLGHKKAFVLNGGWTEWIRRDYKTTTNLPVYRKKTFVQSLNQDFLVSMEDVKTRVLEGKKFNLIDSRDPERYKGNIETIDTKAGHIPTAVNYFWNEGIADNGTFRTKEEQEARFSNLDKEKETIVYCGSGVTACPNVLMLQEAGFSNVKLYAGSWSDWISYEDNEIATTKK